MRLPRGRITWWPGGKVFSCCLCKVLPYPRAPPPLPPARDSNEQKEPLGSLKGCRGFWIQHGITSMCSSSVSCTSLAWWQALHRCHPCSRARLCSLLTVQ